jgi:nucleotide-binding universal stress UspA family protein
MGPPTLNDIPDGESDSALGATSGANPNGRIRPILVPLDGSDLAERALPYAEALAGPDCQLILLEVGQDEEEFQLLDRHADACAQLETVTGDPAQQILQVATQLGVGLIVMTTHGRGALGRWAFGSVADEVARTSDVPVMIIRPGEGDAPPEPVIRRVVAPLDGSPLSEHALPTAEAIALQLRIPVLLVTATDLSQLLPVGLTPAVAFNAEVYEEAVTQVQRDAEGWLTQAATHLHQRGVDVTHEARVGAPFAVIQEIVQPGDVIVLASRGRHGAARLVLGSLAEQLVREGSVPVVLVPARDQVQEHVADHTVPVSPDVH